MQVACLLMWQELKNWEKIGPKRIAGKIFLATNFSLGLVSRPIICGHVSKNTVSGFQRNDGSIIFAHTNIILEEKPTCRSFNKYIKTQVTMYLHKKN